MGKIRTRVLGSEEDEKKQIEEQKKKSAQKKQAKIRAQGLKGGERMSQVEVSDSSVEKMDKAKKILDSKAPEAKEKKTKEKKVVVRQRGKKYLEMKKLVDKTKSYDLKEAIKLLKKMKFAKFDESVELHLNVDKTGLKGQADLPHSIGKTTRVAIVSDALLADIEKGKLEFDVLVTHPSFMPKLARFAKVLGPKGLMPNPKAGTISPKPEEVAKKFSTGGVRWKTEPKAPLVHQMIGKISLDDKAIAENAVSFITSVGKPHIFGVFIKSTMSPSVKLDIEKI